MYWCSEVNDLYPLSHPDPCGKQ